MENNFNRDDSIIETVIFGRIEPKIYAFETDTIPRYLKVGDTFRSVEERLNEWKNAGFSNLQYIGDWSSEIKDKDIYFRDYSVHSYLMDNGKARLTRDVYPDKPYSQEFFKDASRDDVEAAIADVVASSEDGCTKYVYYTIDNRTTIETEYARDSFDWEPRNPLQTDTIQKFIDAKENNRNNLLMYAVMRFGKSFTSLCCAKAMEAKFVLVVSGKADVADEWQQNVQKPGQFDNFVFLNSKRLRRNDKAISNAKDSGKCIVLFLTLQDLSKEKKRFSELFQSPIDLMIIDETHFGARAETLGKVIADAHYKEDTALKKMEDADGIGSEALSSLQIDKAKKALNNGMDGLNVKVKLHLSGTPYRILLGSEFEKDDIISFCQYSDIISEKDKWYNENIAGGKQEETGKEEWENPYYGFPQMIRFAFNLNESSMNRIKQLEEQGFSYHLSALFAPKSVEKDDCGDYKKFEYEQEVLEFLQSIDGTKDDKNVLSFLDNARIKEGKLCRHIVMVLPYCASCDAMAELISKNSFNNLSDYKIINISGIDSEYSKIQDVKSKIAECEKNDQKTITLTVNRMLTGCTVPQWDTMIFLKDTASPQDYDQAIFRLQSQYVVKYEGKEIVNGQEVKKVIKKDMKPQTLLVDFNPKRMFYLQETKSRINNINTVDGGNDESEARIARDLKISPIIHIADNKLVKVKPNDILKAVSEYSTNRGITEAANDIIIDENLINIETIKKTIDKEFEINSGKGFAEQAYSGEETDLEDDDITTSGSPDEDNDASDNSDVSDDDTSAGDNKKTSDIEIFIKKCRSYYRRILLYAFLCQSETEVKNLTVVIQSKKYADNNRIFHNLGIDEDFIVLMSNHMNGAAKRSLDDKIYDLYRLSHEYETEDEDPIKRASTAIQRFGKISDSEVVTPQRIAKEMVDLIPEEDFINVFENGNKFLDIASKMGEFAVAICKRAELLGVEKEKIKNSIYSIPTSAIAYEFTRYIYEKLDLNIDNIASKFNSYSLLVRDEDDDIDYERIASLLRQNKPFNSIRMNDEITEGDEIVNFDVVVGNPPYQVSDGGAQASARPIYHNFVDISKTVEPSFMTLIMPTRWYAGGKGLDEFRNDMLNDENIAELHDFLHPEEVFPDTNNRGGVCYLLWDHKHPATDSAVRIVTHEGNGVVNTSTRKLRYKDLDIFIRNSAAISILDKVISEEDIDTMEEHISPRKPFGLDGNFIKTADFHKEATGMTDPVMCYGKAKSVGYVERAKIPSHTEWIDKWKVFMPYANNIGTELNDDNQNTFVVAPNSICTETFLIAGMDLELNESTATNLSIYLRTRFARFLLSMAKISQHGTAKTYRFVPNQDFTRAWTDAELYAKYSLTEEEIAFIESMIKPME